MIFFGVGNDMDMVSKGVSTHLGSTPQATLANRLLVGIPFIVA